MIELSNCHTIVTKVVDEQWNVAFSRVPTKSGNRENENGFSRSGIDRNFLPGSGKPTCRSGEGRTCH